MRLQTTFATKKELDMIHEASLKILNETGIIFESEAARSLLEKNGAVLEGNKVYFNKEMVEKALETVPSKFEWHGRNGFEIVGEGSTLSAPTYGNIYVKKNGKKTEPTVEDFVNVQKLHQSSDVIDIGNPDTIDVAGVEEEGRLKWQLAVCLRYLTKPVIGYTSGKEDAQMSISMIKEFYGIDDKPVALGLISVAAPLICAEDMIDAMMVYGDEKQPVIVAGSAMPHITSPPGFLSTLAMVNAENLAAITFMQLYSPGNPMIYGITTSSTDLRYAVDACGGINANRYIYACAEMGNYYNMPTRVTGGPSDAQQADYQAGSESALTLFNANVANISFTLHSCGMLDDYNTFGYEKYIMDEESLRKAKHFVKELVVEEEYMLTDLIKEVGPTGHFMSGGTSKHYLNDFYIPKIAFRQGMNITIEEMAEDEYSRRINDFESPELSEKQIEILKDNIPVEIFEMII